MPQKLRKIISGSYFRNNFVPEGTPETRKPSFVNRVPRILGQRAENGVFRVALQGAVSNHPFQITNKFADGYTLDAPSDFSRIFDPFFPQIWGRFRWHSSTSNR